MTKFRPCIDLHQGRVKQIVGGSLSDNTAPTENFVSDCGADWFATLYRDDNVGGGHVIQLGPGNEEAARAALAAWPRGLQVGGGVTLENAVKWLEMGAGKVIVTSWLFDGEARFQPERLEALAEKIHPDNLVVDLSCRGTHPGWVVAMNRWQTPTDLTISKKNLVWLSEFCSEFLIHAADVEGLRAGMDEDLIRMLGDHSPLPVTYAGGASSFEDLARVEHLSHGRVDLTIGSALNLFGGSVPYIDCVAWNRRGL